MDEGTTGHAIPTSEVYSLYAPYFLAFSESGKAASTTEPTAFTPTLTVVATTLTAAAPTLTAASATATTAQPDVRSSIGNSNRNLIGAGYRVRAGTILTVTPGYQARL